MIFGMVSTIKFGAALGRAPRPSTAASTPLTASGSRLNIAVFRPALANERAIPFPMTPEPATNTVIVLSDMLGSLIFLPDT